MQRAFDLSKLKDLEKLDKTDLSIISRAKWGDKVVVVKQFLNRNSFQQTCLDAELKYLPQIMQHAVTYFVTCHGFGLENNNCHAVFDYMENKDLDLYIDGNKPLPFDQRYYMYGEITKGLDYLHTTLKIVHRDMKTPNILLDKNLYPKICDFGFATPIDEHYEKLKGTTHFCVPEILELKPGIHIDEKADIFALAMIGVHLFNWDWPYPDCKTLEVMRLVAQGIKPPLNEDIPVKVALLIKFGWASKNTDRPTANYLSKALSRPIDDLSNLEEGLTPTNLEQLRSCIKK